MYYSWEFFSNLFESYVKAYSLIYALCHQGKGCNYTERSITKMSDDFKIHYERNK